MREPFWLRHDLHIAVLALAILALGWLMRSEAGAPPTKTVTREGLSVEVPADWIVEPAAGDVTVARGEDAVTRVELRSAERPGEHLSAESSLDVARAQRHGPLYQRLSSDRRTSGGREWLRTTFGYAFKPTPTHAPRLASAVEYAALSGGRLLIVTLHAPEERIDELEREVLSTARLAP